MNTTIIKRKSRNTKESPQQTLFMVDKLPNKISKFVNHKVHPLKKSLKSDIMCVK